MTMIGRVAFVWIWALWAGACHQADPDQPAVDRDPALAAFDEDLRRAPLCQLEDAMAALEGRDDLRAIDQRRALDLAWRNRGPAELSLEIGPELAADQHDRERGLREAWLLEHGAYSWDNLDPEAQLEPRPPGLSLTWLVLAHDLPLARNQHPFETPWVRDYFERKSWYTPRTGSLYLSYIDKVQLERLEAELEGLDAATLQAWRDSLPRPGMSDAEAQLEDRLAERLLAGGSVTGDPR